jgi:hypothetical protein
MASALATTTPARLRFTEGRPARSRGSCLGPYGPRRTSVMR